MLKNYLLSPLCSASASHLSLFQPSFSFSFSASFFFFSLLVSTSLFLFCFPVPPFSSFYFSTLFFCLQRLLLFLQTCYPFFFSPKTFFSSAQNIFFSPKTILSSAQNLFQFSPKHFCFKSPNMLLLLIQPLFSFVRASFSVPRQLLRP